MFTDVVGLRRLASRGAAVLALGALLGLAGCATPTPYGPKTPDSATGYTDQQISDTHYRVTFTGNSLTSRETVENYLLLRSAEVTLAAGYEYFVFDTRSTQAKTTYMSTFTGWPGWGGYGWYWHSWPYYYGPYGAYGPFGGPFGPYGGDVTSRPIIRYHAYAEIVLLTPEQAKNEPRALNAHQVIAHLRPPSPPPKAGAGS